MSACFVINSLNILTRIKFLTHIKTLLTRIKTLYYQLALRVKSNSFAHRIPAAIHFLDE